MVLTGVGNVLADRISVQFGQLARTEERLLRERRGSATVAAGRA